MGKDYLNLRESWFGRNAFLLAGCALGVHTKFFGAQMLNLNQAMPMGLDA